jgi:F-type H+-transporting ATPase subunit b
VPQLDVSTFSSQIFWLIICFATLYYLLSRRGLPRVSEILEARQDRMAADLDQAQRLRQEAREALSGYEAVMAKAQNAAHALLTETQNRLLTDAAERQSELDRQLAKQIADAEARIAAAKERALAEIADAAAAAAQAAAERLAGVEVSAKAARTALGRVLKGAG